MYELDAVKVGHEKEPHDEAVNMSQGGASHAKVHKPAYEELNKPHEQHSDLVFRLVDHGCDRCHTHAIDTFSETLHLIKDKFYHLNYF